MNVREIGTWLETEYWMHMNYPSVKETLTFSGLNLQQLSLINPSISSQLEARGLPPVDFGKPVPIQRVVDPLFAAASSLILDTLDKRSVGAKLKSIGMKTVTWNALKEQPINKRFFIDRVNQIFKSTEESAKLGLVKNVETGDLQSIKYYNEVSGVYRPNQEILLNLGVIIGSMMEILATHVDSKTLSLIGDKLDLLMNQQIIETNALLESN